jgi:hypothetical protein
LYGIPQDKNELRRFMRNKAWRKNNLYRIVDESGSKVLYRQRAVQREFAAARHGLDVILKSRQHGFSTECQLDMLDDALFIPNLQCGVIAQTRIDAEEIFHTKVRQPYLDLHPFVRQLVPAVKCDGGTLRLANGSEIRVGVSFRSATTHRLHISEMGKICAKFPARAEEIKTGTLPTVHPQRGGKAVIESTAEGAAGYFYDICMAAQADTANAAKAGRPLSPLQWMFHCYVWWQDPKNAIDPLGIEISDALGLYFEGLAARGIELTDAQRAWYAAKKDGAGGLGVAMKREHPSTPQEAFEQSVEGAVFGEELELARSDGRVGFYPHVKDQPVYTFWDLGYRNATVVGFVQFIGEQVRVIDFYSESGRGAPYHAKQVNEKPYNYAEHHMPHDVMNHEKGTGIVLKDVYQSLFRAPIRKVKRPKLKRDSIEATQGMFSVIHINAKPCDKLVKALACYRYKWDEDACIWSKDPLHDWASDPADMIQTLATQWREGVIGGKRRGLPEPMTHVPAHKADPYRNWARRCLRLGGRSRRA